VILVLVIIQRQKYLIVTLSATSCLSERLPVRAKSGRSSEINDPNIMKMKYLYRAFNATYGRIGRLTSADVVIKLVKKKYLPIILYAIEGLPLATRSYKSPDFAVSCVVSQIFVTRANEIIKYCRQAFGLVSLKELVTFRQRTFLARLALIEHTFGIMWTIE
jgi:hypothetical protein